MPNTTAIIPGGNSLTIRLVSGSSSNPVTNPSNESRAVLICSGPVAPTEGDPVAINSVDPSTEVKAREMSNTSTLWMS